MGSPDPVLLLIGASLWIVGFLLTRLPACGHACAVCAEAKALEAKFVEENREKREAEDHLWLHRYVIGDTPCPKCDKEK